MTVPNFDWLSWRLRCMLGWRKRRRLRQVRLSLAKSQQPKGALLHDPIEDHPYYAKALLEAESLALNQLNWKASARGMCHVYWAAKRQILRERFEIEWFSPAELNDVRFD